MAKLTNNQKIEIYEQRLKGESLKSLSFNFNISICIDIGLISYCYNVIEKKKWRKSKTMTKIKKY